MPRNIEIKAVLPNGLDPAIEIAKSLAIGNEVHAELLQLDTFFNTVNPDVRLKIRMQNSVPGTILDKDFAEGSLISYKRTDSKEAVASDYDLVPVENPNMMIECLRLSNGIKGEVRKDRRVYLVDWAKEEGSKKLTARVHIDHVHGLDHFGDFIEFEVIDCVAQKYY
jgi:adenylate cyclase class IV